jgi:hypothetical protein
MSSSDAQPAPTNEPDPTGQDEAAALESPIGNLTVEDDPEGTVDPSDLAGTASDDDADVS